MKKVAVMGFGTVGSGVAEVLTKNADFIARGAGEALELKYILDVREFPGNPFEDKIIHDFAVIETDPEVSIVVETIGGVGLALDFTRRCLNAGKSVVTSNKELVAKHGRELLGIAKEKNLNYLFEASVGGGIPIILPLLQCLAGNRVDEVFGILNGTTNYILTSMIQNGDSFDAALSQAQKNGYAEQNPAADVEGHDACRKISILSDLCFGKNVDPALVPTEGILGVSLTDVEQAGKVGCRIKLIARTLRVGEGCAAYVAPHLLPASMLLSHVDGVMNAVVVRGNAVGETMFYGPGAGKLPTASAVVADVIDCALHTEKRRNVGWVGDCDLSDPAALASRWYVRADGQVPEDCAVIGECEGGCAFITPAMDRPSLDALLAGACVAAAFRVLE